MSHSIEIPTLLRGIKDRMLRLWFLATVVSAVLAAPVLTEGQVRPARTDLTELSLEELMAIEVTLGARKAETILETAAAVEVITGDDLHRSGVTSIPEALRFVPGLDVARIDANKWAISARGFNNLFANKLQVLVDGRSAYSPMFSGVFWEAQDLVFEDIDRIEVIRGPGASLWGANAVNGIINIVTKPTRDTRGVFLQAGTGSLERVTGSARIGGSLGRSLAYRAYIKYFDRLPFDYQSVAPNPGRWIKAADGWNMLRAGFRIDGAVSPKGEFTFQGDVYDGDVGQTVTLPRTGFRYLRYSSPISGGNLLGCFHQTLSDASDLTIRVTYDQIRRDDKILLGGRYHTVDMDFQHRLRPWKKHQILWGAGYRVTKDRIDSTSICQFDPTSRTFGVWSAFVQDETDLDGDRLRLTAGSKFEYNDFTGFEIQPNLRLLVRLTPKHTAWWSVARAVRTPSRADQDLRASIYITGNHRLRIMTGNHAFDSEELMAYEFGSHHQVGNAWMVDWSCFFNDYRKLQTYEGDSVANNRTCKVLGAELSAKWQLLDWWSLKSGYTFLQMRSVIAPNSLDRSTRSGDTECPAHQAFLRASLDLPYEMEFDFAIRFVDELPNLRIARYGALDARLGWKPFKGVELAVVGQNLNLRHHAEFRGWWIPFEETYTSRSAYAMLQVKL